MEEEDDPNGYEGEPEEEKAERLRDEEARREAWEAQGEYLQELRFEYPQG